MENFESQKVIEALKGLQSIMIEVSEKAGWVKEKRVTTDLFFRKIIHIVESIDGNEGFDLLLEILFESSTREIYDVVPKPMRLIGQPKDRLYSISFENYELIKKTNEIYSQLHIDDFGKEIVKKIGVDQFDKLREQKRQFEYFKGDYENMTLGVPSRPPASFKAPLNGAFLFLGGGRIGGNFNY